MYILAILLTSALLTVFATSMLLLLILTERNLLQRLLAVILGVLCVLIACELVHMLCLNASAEIVQPSLLSFRYLLFGFVVLFSTLSFYMVAAHGKLLSLGGSLLFASPVLLILAVYLGWHLLMNEPMNYDYTSFSDLWANRQTAPVILRIQMYFFLLIYHAIICIDLWKLLPIWAQHEQFNAPNSASNPQWLKQVIYGLIAMLIGITLLLFWPSPYVLLIYTTIVGAVFIFLIFNTIKRKMDTDTNQKVACWSLHEGWKISPEPLQDNLMQISVEESLTPNQSTRRTSTKEAQSLQELDAWMISAKPYCRSEFSTHDITEQFAELDHTTLTQLLLARNENVQSYIRRYRIEEACRIIRTKERMKVGDLAEHVGFSHQTSFSRAFVAVTGLTPLMYMNKAAARKKKE